MAKSKQKLRVKEQEEVASEESVAENEDLTTRSDQDSPVDQDSTSDHDSTDSTESNLPVKLESSEDDASRPVPEDRSLVRRSNYALEKLDLPEPVAQEFQRIKSYILMAAEEAPLKTIAITSAVDGEGASTVAVNTALALSLGHEQRVLLVDANLRSPSIHRYLRLENRLGLTDIMMPEVDLKNAIQELNISHLSVLTAGENQIDPPQFFRSTRFKRILSDLEARFDYVIFDCPPCSLSTDTQTLASRVDGFLMVVKYQNTRREILKNAQTKLEKARGKILGVILNERRFEIPEFIYRRL